MILVLRKIREKLLRQNKFTKYLLYALGEILLVVLGILIALQINNTNDKRKDREKELHYLENITVDINVNLLEIKSFLEVRNQSIAAAETIIGYFEGNPIDNYEEFNAAASSIYNFQKFYQNNNTFQELINSGNLALISNDTIKNLLLDIELLYTKMKSEEEHYRFDIEELIYKPLYGSMDLLPIIKSFEHYLSKGEAGNNMEDPKKYFEPYFKNTMVKNGFVMTILEFNTMNEQMEEMKRMSDELLRVIGREMKRS